MIDLYHFKLLYLKKNNTVHEILYKTDNEYTAIAEFNLPIKNKIDTGNTINSHKLLKRTTFGYFVSPPDNKTPKVTEPTASIVIFKNCNIKITFNVG